jgi:hypothetical protein
MQRNLQTPELLVEEVLPTGDGRFHVATQISRDGAILISSEPSEGKRLMWLRIEIPQNDEFIPVLVEVIYESRLGQFFYRGIHVKHVFEAHRKSLFSYLDRLAVQTSTLREVSHG